MSILEILEDAMEQIDIALAELPHISAAKLRLDNRCPNMWVDVDSRQIIILSSGEGSLNYYGGFEYVDKENITHIGEYTIYQSTDDEDRVGGHISYYEENQDA